MPPAIRFATWRWIDRPTWRAIWSCSDGLRRRSRSARSASRAALSASFAACACAALLRGGRGRRLRPRLQFLVGALAVDRLVVFARDRRGGANRAPLLGRQRADPRPGGRISVRSTGCGAPLASSSGTSASPVRSW